MKYLYHATTEENFNRIMSSGKIKTGFDGIIYLAETREDALKFICLRAFNSPIIVLKIKIPNEKLIEETFDHSYNFFKCRSFGYPCDINTSCIIDAYKYDI